jgi:hypothetical protein
MSENIWTNSYNPFSKWKILCHYERMKKIKTGNFAPPVNIALDINQGTYKNKRCGGFNCNFCMSNMDDMGKSTQIPSDLLLKIPQFYNEWGVKSICVAGHNSDPLTYNHDVLIEFLRLCNKWNVEVGLVSNGRNYTDKLLHEVPRTCNWSGWSINAGTEKTHSKMTESTIGAFNYIIEYISCMSRYIKNNQLNHDMGYKFLITDDNYHEILTAIKVASEIGVRHFQIRPCELPLERTKKIDIDSVEKQIKEGIEKYERPNEFEIFGVREKFNPDFTKKPPERCIASVLGSTWKADGDIVICPDRRWSAHKPDMILGNFIKEGLEAIRRKWGGPEHIKMIEAANIHIKNCIRCTSYSWHQIYENVVENDLMDVTLI